MVEPGEYSVRQGDVLRMGFDLVNENTAVDGDLAVLAEGGAKAI